MRFYGCDTETYYESDKCKGLKSIQLFTSGESYYFTTEDWSQSDDCIRTEISRQFFTYIDSIIEDSIIAFFNLSFDASQFLYYMIAEHGYNVIHDSFYLKKNQIQILETDRKIYSIKIRNAIGKMITMLDIANFLVGVTLDNACKSWINSQKVTVESKRFGKEPATELEKEYAMKDAELTYQLFCKLKEEMVIESKTFTIAGRTIKHFKEFIKENYNLEFYSYFYKTEDKSEIEKAMYDFETMLRYGTRGGICQAFQKGVFEECTHIDARSMYPTQLNRALLPIGPLLNDPPEYDPYTSIVWPSGFYTLKTKRLPCVQWQRTRDCLHYHYINDFEPGDFVTDFMLDGSYPIWMDEYKLIKQNYTVIDESIDKEAFIEMGPNVVLKSYIEMLYEGKRTSTGSKRLYYKYLLNALYGKFLTRPDGITIQYVNDYDGWHRIKCASVKSMYYLPIGAYTAMMGRVTLFNAINSLPYDDVIYCDTDSIVFKGDSFPDVTIGDNLGDWSIEQENVTFNSVGPKTYQELTQDGTVITKCGGLPTREKNKLKWLELKDGMEVLTEKPRRDPNTWAINIEPIKYTISTKASLFRRSS